MSHVFVAENRNGNVVFIAPQRSLEGVKNYFRYAEEGYTLIHRINKLNFTDLIKDCCEEVKIDD